jgi:hypothetical protein
MGVTAAVTAVVGTAYTVKRGEEQKKEQAKALAEQKKANTQAQVAAEKAESRADMEYNRQNQKQANVSSIVSESEQAGKTGAAGTMLTGNMGIDPNLLKLGKNTLLGG